DNRGQDLVGDNFVGFAGQAVSQGAPPGDPQFGIDVDRVDSRGDSFAQVVIIGSRPAMQGEKDSRRFLDLGNSLNVQVLPGFSLDHALSHAVPVAYGRSEYINSGCVDELSRFLRGRKV